MSYTNLHGQPQGIAIYDTILIAEIDAINTYADHIANSNMEDVNKVWRDIIKDEKNIME